MDIIPHLFSDNHTEVFEFIKHSSFFNFYTDYMLKKRFTSKNDVCCLLLKNNDKIIGSTLLILHSEGDIEVGNIACTYIDPNFRGCGFSSLLIEYAKNYCDVLLELTPVDSIIHLMEKKKIKEFENLSSYQLWINPHLIKKSDKSLSISHIEQSDLQLINENTENNISFLKISIGDESSLIGYYNFARRSKNICEIVYVQDINFFSKHFLEIVKGISKKYKFNLFFVDGVFLGNEGRCKVLQNKKTTISYLRNLFYLLLKRQIYLESRKFAYIKPGIKWKVNYLSTELCFYK